MLCTTVSNVIAHAINVKYVNIKCCIIMLSLSLNEMIDLTINWRTDMHCWTIIRDFPDFVLSIS